MFSTEREQLRKMYYDAWDKHCAKLPVEPLEAEIIHVIVKHPEYQEILANPDNVEIDFKETNPFLHMSLHIAVREQVATNRPEGVAPLYQQLCRQYQDSHIAEHKLMECLTQVLWDAQQTGKMVDDLGYLELMRSILSK